MDLILQINSPLVMATGSKSLYDCSARQRGLYLFHVSSRSNQYQHHTLPLSIVKVHVIKHAIQHAYSQLSRSYVIHRVSKLWLIRLWNDRNFSSCVIYSALSCSTFSRATNIVCKTASHASTKPNQRACLN